MAPRCRRAGPSRCGWTPREPGRRRRTREQEAVVVRYTVRHRGARRVVELSLVNGQRAPARTPDVARLYQVGLTVTALDGNAAIFLGHNDPETAELPPDGDAERLHLELLHRDTRQYANGRQCAVDAFVRDGEMRAWKLATTCFPSAEVPLVVPGQGAESRAGHGAARVTGAGAGRPGQGAAAAGGGVPEVAERPGGAGRVRPGDRAVRGRGSAGGGNRAGRGGPA